MTATITQVVKQFQQEWTSQLEPDAILAACRSVAYHLRANTSPRDAAYSVLVLKADCRGSKYVEETLKLLPEKPEPILLAKILNRVASLGRIHTAQPSFSFS